MKVIFLSSYDRHGAGAAALRICRGLQNRGVHADFYVKNKTAPDSSLLESDILSSIVFNAYSGALTFAATDFGDFGSLALGIPEPDLIELCRPYDIINVHWINYFISMQSLWALSQSGKQIVLTMHDENFYTGGCHYTTGCDGYLLACDNCPKLKKSMRRYPPLELENKIHYMPKNAVVVTPSTWLAEKAAKSQVLAGKRIECIPNGIDSTVFTPTLREEARNELGLVKDERMVLFGAQSISDTRKGGHLLPKLSEILGNKRFKICCFGENSGEVINNVTYLGRIDDERRLSQVYSAADVLLLPSFEDNLPNIMLESLLCGTPVAAFKAGGISDAIITGKNGMLVPIGDCEALANAVERIANDKSMRIFCRDDAVKRYSAEVAAENYLRIFSDLASENATGSRFYPNALFTEISRDAEVYFQNWIANSTKREQETFPEIAKIFRENEAAGKKIILYGYGKLGRAVESCFKEKISFIIDGNAGGNEEYIRSPESLRSCNLDSTFIFVAVQESMEIEGKLKEIGFVHNIHFKCISTILG